MSAHDCRTTHYTAPALSEGAGKRRRSDPCHTGHAFRWTRTIHAEEEGIIFTVTPNVSSDKYTINLFMQPLVQKFIGWDDYSYEVPMDITINGNNKLKKRTSTIVRMTKTNVECTDNGTIIMGGMIQDETTTLDDAYPILGDLPLIGRLFQSKGRAGAKKNLMIFLSCRLVNPDGSPLREREDRGLPAFRN